MKYLKSFFAILAVLAIVSVEPAAAQTASAKAFRIATVDMKAVLNDAKVAKDIRTQIEEKRSAYAQEIKAEEEALRQANDELARQRQLLSPEAFKQKRLEFEEKYRDKQRSVQKRGISLEKAQNEAWNKVHEVLETVVKELVEENDLTIIIRRESTVFSSRKLDITSAFVSRLDKKLPTLKVFDQVASGK